MCEINWKKILVLNITRTLRVRVFLGWNSLGIVAREGRPIVFFTIDLLRRAARLLTFVSDTIRLTHYSPLGHSAISILTQIQQLDGNYNITLEAISAVDSNPIVAA